MSDNSKPLLPTIPEPIPSPESLYETVLVMKQAVEMLLGQRVPNSTKADTGVTSGVKAEKQIVSIIDIRDEFELKTEASNEIRVEIKTLEDGVEANSTSITSLETSLTSLESDVEANATAVTTLETRVTTAEGDITANASAITSVEADITNLESGVSGNASAITTLDTRVTSAEGGVTANASAITSVEAEVDDVSASGLFRVVAVAAPGGVSTRLELQARATTADAFASTGLILDAEVTDIGGASQAQLYATDNLGNKVATLVLDSDGSIKLDGNVVVTGSVQTAAVATDAITEATDAYTEAIIDIDATVATYEDIQTVSITVPAGGKALLFSSFAWGATAGAGGNRAALWFRLLRDATEVAGVIVVDEEATNEDASGTFSWNAVDNPGAGTYTYTMQAGRSGSGDDPKVRQRTLIGVVAKR